MSLYGGAHRADCELALVGHDVGGLNVAIIHGVLEGGPSVGVLVAHVAVERDVGSSSGRRRCQGETIQLATRTNQFRNWT